MQESTEWRLLHAQVVSGEVLNVVSLQLVMGPVLKSSQRTFAPDAVPALLWATLKHPAGARSVVGSGFRGIEAPASQKE